MIKSNIRRFLGAVIVFISFLVCLLMTSCSCVQRANYCLLTEPITYSVLEDSHDTIEQVREHNAVWEALCNA